MNELLASRFNERDGSFIPFGQVYKNNLNLSLKLITGCSDGSSYDVYSTFILYSSKYRECL